MAEIKYEIVEEFGPISAPNNGYVKELNLISWNDREPVFDLRSWREDHERMGKGITFTQAEAKALRDLLIGLPLD